MLLLAARVLPAPLREAAADERLALDEDERLALAAVDLLLWEAADDLLALAEDLPFWDELAELLPAPLREAATEERLALDEERSEFADERLVVPRPFLVTVFFLS